MNLISTYLSHEKKKKNLGLEKAAELLHEAVVLILHDNRELYTPDGFEVIEENVKLIDSNDQCIHFLAFSPDSISQYILQEYLESCIQIMDTKPNEEGVDDIQCGLLTDIAVAAGILIETPDGKHQISSAYLKPYEW